MQQFQFLAAGCKKKRASTTISRCSSKNFYVPMILKQTTFFYADIHVDVADDKAIYGCNS